MDTILELRKQLKEGEQPDELPFEYTAHEGAITRELLESDFWATPYEVVEAAVKVIRVPMRPKVILDAGAGDGRWGLEMKKRFPDALLIGVELRDEPHPEGFDRWYPNTDFLTWQPLPDEKPDLIIGNPPFSIAHLMVEKGYELLDGYGQIDFFLRIQFLGSQERHYNFFPHYPVQHVYYCVSRVSFLKKRKRKKDGSLSKNPTNSADVWDYGVCQWNPQWRTKVWSGEWWDYKPYRPKKRTQRGARPKRQDIPESAGKQETQESEGVQPQV